MPAKNESFLIRLSPLSRTRIPLAHASILAVLVGAPACSDESQDNGNGTGASSARRTDNGAPAINVGALDGSENNTDGSEQTGNVCESKSKSTDLLPVHLSFLFDVSGSMGKIEDSTCYDPEFKWYPVVAATTSFFESDNTEGLYASLTLFPAQTDKCDSETYAQPEVGLQALPNAAFRTVLSAYEEEFTNEKWRGSTPTFAAFSGVYESVQSEREAQPSAHYAIVLVTDGKPQGCSDADIDAITAQVGAARDEGISTYVIGVKQPTSKAGCDLDDENIALQENLNAIALSGGTGEPFMIDTSSPVATEEALTTAIQSIRESSDTCSSLIPPHPDGGSFEKDKVDVSVTESGTKRRLAYDPDCLDVEAWHFDDEDSPTYVELCTPVCDLIQADPNAELEIQFLCEPRAPSVR